MYKVLSGEDHSHVVFASFYRKYKGITKYVNSMYYYGDCTIPIVDRVLTPLREMIDSYSTEMYSTLDAAGGKFLVKTHDYLYFSFNSIDKLPELEGVEVIC